MKQKEDAHKPCKCCPWRTELSVCRYAALRNNWEDIKKMMVPFYNKKLPEWVKDYAADHWIANTDHYSSIATAGVSCESFEAGAALVYERAKVLEEALEKIEDPRKRTHKEPDYYTEVGCMMNIAGEALEKWRGKD
jgi:hypothetical protein